MSSGRPWSFQTLSRKRVARPSVEVSLVQGMKWASLVNRSATTRIALHPWLSGRETIMSEEIDFQGALGMGRGRSFPTGFSGNVLVRLQVSHPLTYSIVNLERPGHQ